MLGELSYEGLLRPEPEGGPDARGFQRWRLALRGGTEYRFTARRGAFESWAVRPDTAHRDGLPADDPRTLVLDARAELGLTGLRLADVLAELTSTVANEATRLAAAPSAAELSTIDYDTADGRLTGHPRLVLNKGRVGFSARDRARYAPESGATFALPWVAVRREIAAFRCTADLTEEILLTEELGDQLAEFRSHLTDPDDFTLVPVHPWQLDEILGTLYAAELATGAVVPVGESRDAYRPHQTVRTLANASHPTRRDVKTAVSVRNTLVYRGLASAATLAAPQVTTWLRDVHADDELLRDRYRFDLLGEVASVSVRHPIFGAVDELPYRFHETLGALWREPIRARLALGERAVSFAALPYRGPDGESVLAHLVRQSGMDPDAWLSRVLDMLLTPLLHWLLEHGVGFCPHGQNLILITSADGVPLRVAIKDFAQGVDLLDEHLPAYDRLGRDAAADMLRWPAHLLAQSLFSSVFAGQLRFIAEIADTELDYPRPRLWARVRETVGAYRDTHPATAARFDACGLFAPDVERVCLNREHLAGQGFDKIDRDDEFDVRHGRALNPLAGPDSGGAW
ncbi:IucA/IucC family protein [Actinokineospora sp. 24-640]